MPSLTKVQSGFVEAQGALPLSSGTAAAPGLKFDDHAGTGMFSPSTGEIAFSTSGHSQAVTFKTDGNVGIGQSNPQSKLQIENSGEQLRLTYPSIASYIHEVKSNGDYAIDKDGSERLRITSDGKVGIGEDSPDVRLHVKEQFDTAYSLANVADEANHLLKLENPSTTANAFSGMQFRIGSGADLFFGAIQQTTNHGDFFFANQNSPQKEMMRIKSTGNVGIGTNDPAALLHLESTAANAARLRIGFDSPRYYDIYRGSTTNSGYLNFYGSQSTFVGYIFDGVDGEWMRIKNDGKVGIGEDTPIGQLDIKGNVSSTTQFSGFDGLRIHNANGSAFGVTADMYFTAGTGSSNRGAAIGSQLVSGYGNDLYFATNGGNVSSTNTLTERLRINSAGRVLVGHHNEVAGAYDNTAQTKQLQIINGLNSGDQGLGIYSFSSAGWAPRIELAASRSTSFGGHTVVTDGQSCGLMVFNGSDGTNFSTAAMISANVNGTPANDSIPGSLSFHTSPGAGLVERLRITSGGKIGVGVIPAAWHSASSSNVIQVGNSVLFDYSAAQFDVGHNYYYDGSNYKFTSTGYAERITFSKSDGSIGFWSLGTGSADATATVSERLRITSAGKLHLKATGGSGVIADFQEGTSASDSESLISVTTGYSSGSNEGSVRFGSKRTGNGNSGHFILSTRPNGSSISGGWYTRFMVKDNGQIQFNTHRAIKYSNEGASTSVYNFRLAINMTGSTAYTIRLRGMGNGAHHFRLMGSHWTGGYALVKESYYYTNTYDGLSETSVHNITSGTQGAWSVSRPASGQTGYQSDVIITKSAGSYGGGMVGMIDITTPNDLYLVSIT